jgi:hypothetical protein
VTEIFLDGFNIVPVLQAHDSEAMTKIMEPGFGDSHLAHNLLKMFSNCHMGKMSAR